MSQELVLSLGNDAIKTALLLGAPVLLAALIIGLLVSFFQAITQINEATLSFIPKILGIVVVLSVFGPWMLELITSYTADLINNVPSLIRIK